MSYDFIVIGAGPAGLACAIEAKKRNLKYLVIEKGCLVNSVYKFPTDMVFFTTPELLSIGELVFVSNSFRPTRMEGLNYYRAVASYYDLTINTYEEVTGITQASGSFEVATNNMAGKTTRYSADKVIIATGYYDNPNMLGIEGEERKKVSHYYTEAHPYNGCEVAIIGGKNSAVEAALLYQRAGANVTIVHRGPTISDSVKYWVRPDIEKRLESGKIKAMFNSRVTKIDPDTITVTDTNSGNTIEIANDFVFALTGYHPDVELLRQAGVRIDERTKAPEYDKESFETNVPGLYVAGSIAAGINNNKIFIENSRGHGKSIMSER